MESFIYYYGLVVKSDSSQESDMSSYTVSSDYLCTEYFKTMVKFLKMSFFLP